MTEITDHDDNSSTTTTKTSTSSQASDPPSQSSRSAKESTISEYEKTRQENIDRNNAFLKEIGLFEVKQNLDQQTISPLQKTKSTTKRKSKESTEEGEGGTLIRRKSTRLSKTIDESGEGEPLLELPNSFKEPAKSRVSTPLSGDVDIAIDEEERSGRLTSENLSNHIEKKSPDHFENAKPDAINHTVHRINTMSNKQLALRMRKITNTDKMILFYYALDCIGLTELAHSAKEILSKVHHVEV